MNNIIFVDKNWDLLDYFDFISVGYPSKLLYNFNTKKNNNIEKSNSNNLYVNDFSLTHHTQYNFMRQEQITTKKKINIDYLETFNNDIINIYYNLKKFKSENNQVNTTVTKTKKKKISNDEQKYIIDRSYIKYLDKIDELLR
jgi:hypothetical protein